MTMTPVTDKTDSVEAGRHTSGPWTIGNDCEWSVDTGGGNSFVFVGPEGSNPVAVAIVADSWSMDDELDANAALIAAAPELLEAAQKVLAHLEARIEGAPSNAVPVFDGIAELHDAISKAEGRP